MLAFAIAIRLTTWLAVSVTFILHVAHGRHASGRFLGLVPFPRQVSILLWRYVERLGKFDFDLVCFLLLRPEVLEVPKLGTCQHCTILQRLGIFFAQSDSIGLFLQQLREIVDLDGELCVNV